MQQEWLGLLNQNDGQDELFTTDGESDFSLDESSDYVPSQVLSVIESSSDSDGYRRKKISKWPKFSATMCKRQLPERSAPARIKSGDACLENDAPALNNENTVKIGSMAGRRGSFDTKNLAMRRRQHKDVVQNRGSISKIVTNRQQNGIRQRRATVKEAGTVQRGGHGRSKRIAPPRSRFFDTPAEIYRPTVAQRLRMRMQAQAHEGQFVQDHLQPNRQNVQQGKTRQGRRQIIGEAADRSSEVDRSREEKADGSGEVNRSSRVYYLE